MTLAINSRASFLRHALLLSLLGFIFQSNHLSHGFQSPLSAGATSTPPAMDNIAPFYLNQPPLLSPEQQVSKEDASISSAMTVVPPSDAEMVDLLQQQDCVLRRPGVQLYFEQLLLLENTSVRRINAGRYEVFVADVGDKDSTAFDWLCSKLTLQELSKETIKQKIVDYAKRQAVAAGYSNYQFHNFALIINYNECPQQYPHIDLQEPNAQFALMVTDHAPGTVWFDPQHEIQTPLDLAQAWQQHQPHSQSPSPTAWIQSMEHSPKCRSLLRRFGDVLSPSLVRHEPNRGHPLPTGTLLSLPGGVVHAGPKSLNFRAVLFFSGHPTETTIPPYNPDVQYFDSILLSDMIAAVWEDLTTADRIYLLQKLVMYLQAAEYQKMHLHLPSYSSMHQFARRIERKEVTEPEEIEEYIQRFADQERLVL